MLATTLRCNHMAQVQTKKLGKLYSQNNPIDKSDQNNLVQVKSHYFKTALAF